MSQIEVYPNTNPFTVPVTLGSGKNITLHIRPNEAFFDRNGYVRLFSMKFDNGEIGNFKLLPNNQSQNQALNMIQEYIIPLGIGIIGGEIIGDIEGTPIDNVGRFLFAKFGNFLVNDIFDRSSLANSSYYEMTSGELVIQQCVQVPL